MTPPPGTPPVAAAPDAGLQDQLFAYIAQYMPLYDLANGYQLFMTYRVGYHLPLFGGRLFLEPSVAMTHWPVNTNVPDSFADKEAPWPNYFLFEPGLHIGINL